MLATFCRSLMSNLNNRENFNPKRRIKNLKPLTKQNVAGELYHTSYFKRNPCGEESLFPFARYYFQGASARKQLAIDIFFKRSVR